MIHEQMTLTGELEITDSRTMKVIARKMILTATQETRLKKKRYCEGSQLEVTFPAHVDIDEGKGSGPWEPGGYDSRWLKEYAIEIRQVPAKGSNTRARKEVNKLTKSEKRQQLDVPDQLSYRFQSAEEAALALVMLLTPEERLEVIEKSKRDKGDGKQ